MSRFYCEKKKCRKTAWDTPEYLNTQDWAFLSEIIEIIKNNNPEELFAFLWSAKNKDLTEAFFNRSLGWPEGYNYYREFNYCGLGFLVIKRGLGDKEVVIKARCLGA